MALRDGFQRSPLETKTGRLSIYFACGAFVLFLVAVPFGLITGITAIVILGGVSFLCGIWWLLIAGTEMDPAVDGDSESWGFLMFWPFGFAIFALIVTILFKAFDAVFGTNIFG